MNRMLTANPVARRLAATTAAIIILLTLTAALPGKAQASTMTCSPSPTPSSCLKLDATSTVERITVGVKLGPFQRARGYFHVWGHGINAITNSAEYWNHSTHDQTFRGPSFVTRLPRGSIVCAQFVDDQRGARPPICAPIPT